MTRTSLPFLALSLLFTGCAVDDDAPPTDGWEPLETEVRPDGTVELPAPDGRAVYVGADGRVRWTDELPPALIGETLASESFVDPSDVVRADPSIVFDDDERQVITSTSELTSFNKRTIGRVAIGCTGSLVGPRHVLTAAHCVLDDNGNGVPASQLAWTPGRRGAGFGDTTPNGPARTLEGYFVRSNNDIWDYALLILNDSADTAALGYMGMYWNGDSDWYEDRTVYIAGYPGAGQTCADAPSSTAPQCGGFMYKSHCEFDDVEEDFEYECDTSGGMSGSAVYTYINGGPRVIGVHRGYDSGTIFDSWNKGVRLTSTKIGDLCDWIGMTPSAFGAEPCS